MNINMPDFKFDYDALLIEILKNHVREKFDFHGLTVYTHDVSFYLVGINDCGDTRITNFLSTLKGKVFTSNVAILTADEWQSFKGFMEAVDGYDILQSEGKVHL